MHEIEIHDGVIQVDASIVGESLGLEPFEVQSSDVREKTHK